LYSDAVAFRCEGESRTFGQLETFSNQIAGALSDQGVSKGDRIGILLEPSLESADAVYGITKTGAAFVPLDPESPPNKLRSVIQHCGITHLISGKKHRRTIEAINGNDQLITHVIGIDELESVSCLTWDDTRTAPRSFKPNSHSSTEDLAYIMYTSGTTGLPKGIMHSHRSGLGYARLSAELYGVSPLDRLGNHSPLHFDISTMGYLTAPFAGACTVIITSAYKLFPASLSQLIEDEELTIWYSVPFALTELLEKGVLADRDLSSLRWILFGGEPFPPKHLRSLLELLPNAIFSNVYGPAEVNQCTFKNFKSIPDTDKPIPLGNIWSETEAMIVDEYNNEVTLGETGELLISSVTRMLGYWNQPELTDRDLLTTVGEKELTFYRTGDLVKQNKAKELVFVGRKDRQIKLRGFRVELNEIEALLLSHDSVSDSAVFATEDEIKAVVVIRHSSPVAVEELYALARNHLPKYAVPSSILEITSVPRTGAGKIDYDIVQTISHD